MSRVDEQLQRMKTDPGFIAALDQSGGSTPGALRAYGIAEGAWSTDEEMFAIVHQMRSRIITSPAFTGERILGAILFEGTMDRDIAGQPSADYLWNVKRVVPFLKVDKGLAGEGRPLRGVRTSSEGRESGRALGRVHTGRRQRAPAQESRRRGELLAGAGRRPLGTAVGCRVQRPPGRNDSEHLRGVHHVKLAPS